ncbi:MAG: Hpt domain-containing protein [Bdellovibrionota bacterium]
MSDYKLFDTFYDAVLVVDEQSRCYYGNVAATLLLEMSARRLSSGKPVTQFVTMEPDPIAAEGDLAKVGDATQLREIVFTTSNGKKGWAQVVLQPVPEFFPHPEDEPKRFVVCLRDVTLERVLHEKDRAELDGNEAVIADLKVARSQLEDYSANLEKMVEARTLELRDANQLLKTILDSLGQGILVFDKNGNCLPVFSQVCVKLFGSAPAGREIGNVLGYSETETKDFANWRDAVFGEMMDFEDLVPLAPSRLPIAPPTEISLGYNPMRDSKGALAGVVLIATDRTSEMRAIREAQRERELVKKVVQVARHRDAFLMFVEDARTLFGTLGQGTAFDRGDLERHLHTLKGGAATFGLSSIAHACHELEDNLKKSDPSSPEFRALLAREATHLREIFEHDMNELADLLGPMSKGVVVEVPVERFKGWAQALLQAKSFEETRKIGREIHRECTEKPVASTVSHYEPALKELAESLGKRFGQLEVVGGDTRAPMDRMQGLFSSLVHAFRNSIDHGLEKPEERTACGKPEEGHLRIEFKRSEQELAIDITDDGKGVNVARLREKLTEAGRNEFAKASDEEIAQVILLGDLSTADAVTEVSGRGVGVSAIAAEVKALGGTVYVRSRPGKGTILEIRVPLEADLVPVAKAS